MEIYYYCSYKGSPVGFQLGKVTYTDGGSKVYPLDSGAVKPLLQRGFDQSMIRRFCAHSSEKKEFILLAKGLTAKGTRPEDPVEYYINFAFVTDSEADYQKWFRAGNSSEQAIADAVRDTMELDKQSKFGFTVRGDKLEKLLGMSYRKLFENISDQWGQDALFVESISPNTTPEQLRQVLKLPAESLDAHKLTGSWVKFCKKKREPEINHRNHSGSRGGCVNFHVHEGIQQVKELYQEVKEIHDKLREN